MIRKAFRVFKIQSYYIFGVVLLCWLFTPFAEHFLGFGVGLLVSVYCAWLLGNRIERMGENVVSNKRAPSLGTANRLAAAILGAIVLYKIEHQIALWAFVVGILAGHLLLIINLGYYSVHDEAEQETTRKGI